MVDPNFLHTTVSESILALGLKLSLHDNIVKPGTKKTTLCLQVLSSKIYFLSGGFILYHGGGPYDDIDLFCGVTFFSYRKFCGVTFFFVPELGMQILFRVIF